FRDDGGSGRHHARFNVLCVLRDGVHHRVEGVRRGDAGWAWQHHRGNARWNPVRLDRDVQCSVPVVGLQGWHRHDPADRHSPDFSLRLGRTVAEPQGSASFDRAAPRYGAVRRVTRRVVAGLIVLAWVEADKFALHILSLIAIASIAAMGLQVLLGYSGQLSIGQAAFYGIGAYTSALLT